MATVIARPEETAAPEHVAPSVRRSSPIDLAAVFTAGAALGGWLLGLRRLSDNSFFVHLVTGRLIVRSGIPHHDVYSFTAPGQRWIVQSWLVEWAYGRLDAAWGGAAIRVFIGVVGALLFAGLYRLVLRTCGNRRRAAGVVLAALGPIAAVFDERPLAVGLLALLAVVWCVEVPDSTLGRRPVIVLPLVLWLWASSHGTFALGLLYIGLHLLGRAIEGAPPWRAGREQQLLVGACAGAALICVNPFGPALLTFPIELLGKGDVLRGVTEWMSPDFHTWGPMTFAAFLAVLVVATARGHRPVWRDLVVTVPFLLLALWAVRNIAIATIVAAPVLARTIATPRSARDAVVRPDEARASRLFLAAVAALAVVLTASAFAQPSFDTKDYSVRALRTMERSHLIGRRLLTTDANAAYVLGRDWPRQRVFIDDRYDMYPRAVAKDYDELLRGGPRWQAILDHYRVEVVIWPRSRSLASLLAASGSWHRFYVDRGWVVYTR